MRFEIVYQADYTYPVPVSESLNSLRVKPAVTRGQTLESFDIRVTPDARVNQRRDYFGTEVLEFGIDQPHTAMKIVARAEVLTDDAPELPNGTWAGIETDKYRFAAGEFLLMNPEPPELGKRLDELVDEIREFSPSWSAMATTNVIPATFEYRQGSTWVNSTIADLLSGGAGVCQDFVHLALLLLRRHGIGARYVSGYLFAAPADGGSDSVEVETHAWIEALLPIDDTGDARWIAFDPTNGGQAGSTHVKIGHGRRYADVPPIRGIYRGPAADSVMVGVRMSRINGD